MYILLEGIDTCGKSTQIALLKERYPQIITTKEPGGTPFGIKAREILLQDKLRSKESELLLFLADRAEHYESVVKPNKNRVVVSDRGCVSGIAYALTNTDFTFETLLELNLFALQGKLPDLVILFLTNINTLRSRSSKKEPDTIELRGLEYLLQVQENMQKTLLKLNIPSLIIDATDAIEDIHQQIVANLQEIL